MQKEDVKSQDKNFSDYCLKHRLPSRMIKTRIIAESDPEWKERLKSQWWESDNIQSHEKFLQNFSYLNLALDAKMEMYKDFHFLHNVLLAIGGSETCFCYFEKDMGAILKRGRYFNGQSRMMKGELSQCHRNSCELWCLNHEEHSIHICTGYALSEDGMWRQHSWLLLLGLDGKETVVETTIKRKAYYGFVMSDEEAFSFVKDNF